MPIKVKTNRAAQIMRQVSALANKRVLVGIPSEDAARRPEAGEKSGPLTNAALGYIHEFGAPEANIPARPFLVPGITSVEGQFVAEFRAAAKIAAEGGDASDVHHRVGLIAQNAARAALTDGPHAPLTKRTLSRRRARGRKGEVPLIDTGQLRRAVGYVIRKQKV